MPAIDHADAAKTMDDELAPWKSRVADYFGPLEADGDVAIWDDWGVVEALHRENAEQELILSDLVRLTETSISGYLEILEFSADARLARFAEVVVRQRAAQCVDLRGLIDRERSSGYFEHELSELGNLWRVAIWNLEQNRQREFIEFTERAEALLEETLLTAAKAFRDDPWSRRMTDFAVAVCGAITVWEDLGQQDRSEPVTADVR